MNGNDWTKRFPRIVAFWAIVDASCAPEETSGVIF
jgi:hypothetical protein